MPVPAAFRRGLGEGSPSLVLTQVDECLAAYPPAEWGRLEQQLRAMPAFSAPVKALARRLLSRAADCTVDVQGRILLPPALRAAAGLEREAVVVGVLDRFEIWAPPNWEAFLRNSERLLDDASLEVSWPLAAPAACPTEPPAAPRPPRKPKR